MAMAATTSGRLRKKIARQDTAPISTPATSGPIAAATAPHEAQEPIAAPRSSPLKEEVRSARVLGITSAAAAPWTKRNAMSTPPVGARPQARDAMPKAPSP